MAARVGIALVCASAFALVACHEKVPALPKDAGAATAPAAQAKVKLCEHRVPAELCTQCNPDLAEVFKEQGDWCNEHGVPESQCRECNPGLTFTTEPDAPGDWCNEHKVPESMCTKCKPELVAKFIEAGDYCREHGFPQSVCPVCNAGAAEGATAEGEALPNVKLASEETATEIGVKTVRARKGAVSGVLEVVGELAFNANQRAELSARGEALIVEVKVDVGDEVKKGQPLVVVTSAEVGAGQAQASASKVRLSTAQSAVDRARTLVDRGISAKQTLEEAEAEFARARSEYDAALSALAASGAGASGTGGRHAITAPMDGTVVRRSAVLGRTAAADEVLVELADLSTVWALLDVPEADSALVRTGQAVKLTLDAASNRSLSGRISRVADAVDPMTRTVRARVELANKDRRLKVGSFVRARIEVAMERTAIVIPRSALQRVSEKQIVFVRQSANVFAPRAVTVGETIGDTAEVEGGIGEGDEVVTTGAFLLKTEVMKESIGAGCCAEDGE